MEGLRDSLNVMFRQMKDGAISEEQQARLEEEYRRREIETKRAKALAAIGHIPEWWTIENYRPVGPDGHEPYKGIKAHIEAIRAGDAEPVNFVLLGPTDSGKSHLAMAIARVYIDMGKTVKREVEPDVFDFYRTHIYRHADSIAERKAEAQRSDVLVWDDLGKIQIANGLQLTDFGSFVFGIFDKRAEARKLNIITSRYDSLSELAKVTGSDLIRRIRHNEAMNKTRSAVYEYKTGRVV